MSNDSSTRDVSFGFFLGILLGAVAGFGGYWLYSRLTPPMYQFESAPMGPGAAYLFRCQPGSGTVDWALFILNREPSWHRVAELSHAELMAEMSNEWHQTQRHWSLWTNGALLQALAATNRPVPSSQ